MKTPRTNLTRTLSCCCGLWLAATASAETILQWDFNSGDLSATAGGQPMTYWDGLGGAATLQSQTAFGSTTSLGLPAINGLPAQVMGFPACTQSMGYQMPTPAQGNAGGYMVNDYTLVMDLLYTGSAAKAWRGLIQIDDIYGNNNDADFFVDASGAIGVSSSYQGKLLSNTWHRVGIVVDGTAQVIRKYVDGTLVGTQPNTALDGRWGLSPSSYALLFTDNDGETAPGYVNSIQLRDRALNTGEMAVLGGPSAAGIPQAIATVPSYVDTQTPADGAVNVSPLPTISAVIHAGSAVLNTSSIKLALNGVDQSITVTPASDSVTVAASVPSALQPQGLYLVSLRYSDSLAGFKTNNWSFTVADFQSVSLPAPIYLETFDELAEGTLPVGWSATNATTVQNIGPNLDDPASDSYLDWVCLSSNRLVSVFGAGRVQQPPIVLNGTLLPNLVSNNLIYAESDNRAGEPSAQVQVLFTCDYNLTGRTNIYLVYNSLYVQNQDSFGAVEYSMDGGATWLPLLYMLDGADIMRDANGGIDAVATLTNAQPDQAYGLGYGAFIGATIGPALAPFISGRVNDDQMGSKRIEILRCTAADNQATVRFRFLQTGTSSWFFGLDNFGLYSLEVVAPPAVTVSPNSQTDVAGMTGTYFTANANGLGPLTYQWRRNGVGIPGQTNPSLTLSPVQLTDAGQYTVVVRNGGGAVTSAPPVTLTVLPPNDHRITGQWDFNSGDLRATVGQDLQFFSPEAQASITFGTTTTLGIPDIAGQPAKVAYWVPGYSSSAWAAFLMNHGVEPNGGGARVNQYTLIMDLLYPAGTTGYRGLLQTDDTNNTTDSDLFINGSDSIGISGSYQGALTAGTWHRVVFAFDLTQRELGKYIDGVNVLTSPAGTGPFGPHLAQYLATVGGDITVGQVDQRWSLGPTALLLADGDDGEVQPVYVSSIQIRSGRMSDTAIAALGGPTANKISGVIKASKSGGSIVVNWTGSVLESAPSLKGPWTTVPGAAHPHTVAASSGNVQFFRVRQ